MAFFKEKLFQIKNVFAKKQKNIMKTFYFMLISFGMLLATPMATAQNAEIPAEIITAFDNGNVGQLTKYLNSNVELVIETKNDVFSKQQASSIIADFFRKNKVINFQLLHKGNKDAASFAIGILKTSTGNFRVYVLTRKNEIQQLRIEPSND